MYIVGADVSVGSGNISVAAQSLKNGQNSADGNIVLARKQTHVFPKMPVYPL